MPKRLRFLWALSLLLRRGHLGPMKSPSPDILFSRRYICPSPAHRVSSNPEDHKDPETCPGVGQKSRREEDIIPPNIQLLGILNLSSFPRLPLAFQSRRCLHWGGTCTQNQAKGDGTHSCHGHQPLWAVSSPHPHPLISWATCPGLTWFCLYLERGKTQREVPPEKPSPQGPFPLVQKESLRSGSGPLSQKSDRVGLSDRAWLGWKPDADRQALQPSFSRQEE